MYCDRPDCLTSGSSTTILNRNDSKERGGSASHTRLAAELAQITERRKSLHLFRTDQTWEENLLRVINTIKTICDQRNSWTANCWRQGEHFEEVPLCVSWFCTISGILTLRMKLLRDGLWDCSILYWEIQAICVYPSFSGVKHSKTFLIKIMCAKKYLYSCHQNLFHAQNSTCTKYPDETNLLSKGLS